MNQFKVINENQTSVMFELRIRGEMKVMMNVYLRNGQPYWNFASYNPDDLIMLYNKMFIPFTLKTKSNSEKTLTEINEGFYELVKQIKNHPKYRLKIMNVLDKALRDVWEAV